MEVRYNNASAVQRSFNVFDYKLATVGGARWTPTVSWREPSLNSGDVLPGLPVLGWITFEIPFGLGTTHLIWEPEFDVTLAIPFSS